MDSVFCAVQVIRCNIVHENLYSLTVVFGRLQSLIKAYEKRNSLPIVYERLSV